GPAAFRITQYTASKVAVKPAADYVWVDEQTQPLPRSARQYLHGWIRAEELAIRRWGAEAVVFEVPIHN
ncbi:jg894, partial [Pararge aegeria aegeria]